MVDALARHAKQALARSIEAFDKRAKVRRVPTIDPTPASQRNNENGRPWPPVFCLARRAQRLANMMLPLFSATWIVSPATNLPERISFARGFSISCWMARLSGRAP